MGKFWRNGWLGLALLAAVGCGVDDAALRKAYEQGLFEYNRGNRAGALVLFERVHDRDPGATGAGVMIGRIRFYDHDWAGAEAVFSDALGENPARMEALLWRAKARRAAGRRAEALADLERLLELDAGHTEAWIQKGQVLEEMDQLPEAIAAYRLALSAGERLAVAHERLAAIYDRAGLAEQAKKHRERARELRKDRKD